MILELSHVIELHNRKNPPGFEPIGGHSNRRIIFEDILNIAELLKMHNVNFYKSNDSSWPFSAQGKTLAWFLNDFQDEDFINEALDWTNQSN